MSTENQVGGVSRRDLLKKGAVAGGIVWTAPMVLGGVAGAQTTPTGSEPPPVCNTWYAGQFVTPGGASGIEGATCLGSLGEGNSCFPDRTYNNGCSTVESAVLEGGNPVVYLYERLGGSPTGALINSVAGFSKAQGCDAATTVGKVGNLWRIQYPPTVTNTNNGNQNAVSNVQFVFCTP